MLTMEQIRLRLQDRNLRRVSELTGIGYATVLRIARGRPALYETARRLSEYLEANP